MDFVIEPAGREPTLLATLIERLYWLPRTRRAYLESAQRGPISFSG